ncbi:cupin domain-containing protein [Candidatus Electronema sp. JM]|uniref:cupin domain-containing protein n=1 Tax=Candidatus Electronema sp. JM TaxID=3401571 RepID=UPI003AA887B0
MKQVVFGVAAILLLLPRSVLADEIAAAILQSGSASWDGGAFAYPQGQPEISVQKITAHPNGKQVELPVHCHPVPLSGYVLKGSVTVVTAAGKSRLFKTGEAFIEVSNTWHKGIFNEDTELLVFYAGKKGVPLVVKQGDSSPFAKECK